MRRGAEEKATSGQSEETQLKEYAVYQTNFQNRTPLVGHKKPNALGLPD
jgi:hypothetical protein